MNVNTIVLDEFDELLSDSQYHFVTKISHHVPRDHQMIYISATNKIDDQVLVENTIVYDLSDQELDTIKHYYISVDKRNRVELLRKFSNIPDFRGLVFFNSLSDLGATEERLQFNGASAVSLASDINVKFRKVILEKFKNHEISLLLGTDLLHEASILKIWKWSSTSIFLETVKPTLTVQVVPAVWAAAPQSFHPFRKEEHLISLLILLLWCSFRLP